LAASPIERPTVLCLSHVMPWPPRAGNEYRIYRLLRWLRDQGYRIIPVIAPMAGDHVEPGAVRVLAEHFSNAVLCHADGRIDYILDDVPDVLGSLNGELTGLIAPLLDEGTITDGRGKQLLQIDRTFCHDTLIATVLRLDQVLGPYVLLAEYIWMSRVLPLISGRVLKVVDTIDVFSTKRDKVLQFGIDDWHIEPQEEQQRLQHADLVLAIQDEERHKLQSIVPRIPVLTAGVDFDVVDDGGKPEGRRVLYVASDNPMNKKGLQDFLRFAWPRIRREVPDAELLVAGAVSRTLVHEAPGVTRLGSVPDLRPLYAQARLVINPAVAGTGLKIKTLEALCHLRPLVTWPSGTDGLAPELAALCLTASDWYEFAQHVVRLLESEQPQGFSPAEHELVVRLTSASTVYRDLTGAAERFFKNA
jgi:glycosyltransferase involved in cell wall biosynthesis